MAIRIYKTKAGKQPFIKWYDDLKEQSYQLRIHKRLRQITFDNFCDSKSMEDGVYELRFFYQHSESLTDGNIAIAVLEKLRQKICSQ
jgi:putative component of toxin-antitoxin plasmid stabilization module